MELKPLLQLSLTLMVGAGLAYYGLRLGDSEEAAETTSSGPVAVINGLSAWQTDSEGRLLRQFHSDSLHQFSDPERYLIQQPRLTLYQDGMPAWHVRSERAESGNPKQDIVLLDQVVAQRDVSLGQALTLTTTRLHANPEQNRLFTSEPVQIRGQQGIIRGRGLDTNLQAGTLSFSSDVEVRYAPAP